ncbi:MAG: T9SS type A sorting domain-containing protein [Bacteroidetes bacterium]|nr:T9SS type A sorting domain-containing protein [Bacteroidota bacterium]
MKNANSTLFKLLILISIFSFSVNYYGQVFFQKTYPTTFDKTSRDILPTADGGYILAGSTNNTTINDCDLNVVKTDNAGNLLWEKQFGGSLPDYAYSMVETSDGNYFITGYTQSFGGGDLDVYLIKIDPSGNLLWQKDIGSFTNEEGREIIKTSDGNYVICGSSNLGPNSQAMLMKIDLAGNVLWTKKYGGANQEFGNSAKECSDGGFILTGQTFSSGQNGDTYLVRTDVNGDTLWTKTYGTALADEGVCVVNNSDGSYTFVVRDSTASRDVDVRVIKTDASGNLLWNKVYSGTLKDTPKSICSTADGGYMIGAISRSFGWINPDMWLLKLDGGGDTLWTRHFGGSDHEHCHKAKEWDGGYIAVGHARSYGPGQKVMFVKMNNSGGIVASVNNNVAFENDLKVYPNPAADGLINVTSESGIPLKIKLINLLGQVVYAGAPEDKTIDLGVRQQGVYLLTIESQKGISTRKVVIGK